MTTVEPGGIPSGDDMMPVRQVVQEVVQGLKNNARILSYFVIRQAIGSAEISMECTECGWRLNVSMAPTPLIKLVNEASQHYYECEGSTNDDDETGSATD